MLSKQRFQKLIRQHLLDKSHFADDSYKEIGEDGTLRQLLEKNLSETCLENISIKFVKFSKGFSNYGKDSVSNSQSRRNFSWNKLVSSFCKMSWKIPLSLYGLLFVFSDINGLGTAHSSKILSLLRAPMASLSVFTIFLFYLWARPTSITEELYLVFLKVKGISKNCCKTGSFVYIV